MKAHGQNTIRTVTALMISFVTRYVTIDASMQIRTTQVAQRSAMRTIGALSASASCTSLIILSIELSISVLVAVILKMPNWLIVPAKTSSPVILSTGMGSPVIMD